MENRKTPLVPGENNTLHDEIVRLLFPVKNIHQTADEIETFIDKEVTRELESLVAHNEKVVSADRIRTRLTQLKENQGNG